MVLSLGIVKCRMIVWELLGDSVLAGKQAIRSQGCNLLSDPFSALTFIFFIFKFLFSKRDLGKLISSYGGSQESDKTLLNPCYSIQNCDLALGLQPLNPSNLQKGCLIYMPWKDVTLNEILLNIWNISAHWWMSDWMIACYFCTFQFHVVHRWRLRQNFGEW